MNEQFEQSQAVGRESRRRDKQTNLAIDTPDYDAMWHAKERYTKMVGKKVTWTEFLTQASIILDNHCKLLPSVQAIRYNRYIYGAVCPSCGTEAYPLKRYNNIVWRIKCDRRYCRKEFIALS